MMFLSTGLIQASLDCVQVAELLDFAHLGPSAADGPQIPMPE